MRVTTSTASPRARSGGRLMDGRSPVRRTRQACVPLRARRDATGLALARYGLRPARRARIPRIASRLFLRRSIRTSARADRRAPDRGTRLLPRRDVRHIVLTHLDFDHAGGLDDFPDARSTCWAPRRGTPRASAPGSTASATGRSSGQPHALDDLRRARRASAGMASSACAHSTACRPTIAARAAGGHTLGHAGIAVRDQRRLAARSPATRTSTTRSSTAKSRAARGDCARTSG